VREDSRGCQTQTGFASTSGPCPAASPAGVEAFGVNTLRHSAAVDWLESGVQIKAVADLARAFLDCNHRRRIRPHIRRHGAGRGGRVGGSARAVSVGVANSGWRREDRRCRRGGSGFLQKRLWTASSLVGLTGFWTCDHLTPVPFSTSVGVLGCPLCAAQTTFTTVGEQPRTPTNWVPLLSALLSVLLHRRHTVCTEMPNIQTWFA